MAPTLAPHFIPFLLPLARSCGPGPGPVQWVLQVFVLSPGYRGPAYLIPVGALVWWMRGKGERKIRRALRLAPLLKVPIFRGCLSGYLLWTTWPGPRASDFRGTRELSGYGLVLGYACVLLVTLFVALVTRARRRSWRTAP